MVDQKCFYHQSWHYSLLFLLLEDNILNLMFRHLHFRNKIQKVYLLLQNLDQVSNLSIDFAHMFFGSDWYLFHVIFLLKQILIVEVILHYPELIKLLLEYNFFTPYCKSSWTCRISNNTEKFLTYLNSTIISTPFIWLSWGAFPVYFRFKWFRIC